MRLMMSKKSEMSYEEMMSIHRQENRQTPLSKIPTDFYDRAANYLEALEHRCTEGKTTPDVSGMLLSQLKTAKTKSAEIYEVRMRKIVLTAMASAFGAEPKIENLTPEEKTAFDKLKSFFIEHRKQTLSPKCEGETGEIPPELTQAKTDAPAEEKNEAKAEDDEIIAKASTINPGKSEMVMVRILEDLPAFAGADKNYQLMKEDVISLPKNYAEILLKHNKAVEIRQSI